jgi:type IV pilus assembly protein PilC
MIRSNLRYTIGVYNESPEEPLSTSGPALLAQTLAWAAQNNIPFQDVILSLSKNGARILNPQLFLIPRSRNWDKCLLAAYRDLTNGCTLYETLRSRFDYFLPEYYLQAVEKAEKEGHLQETLPAFSKRLNFSLEIRKYYKQALTFPFMELLLIFAMLSLLTTFIFPNLHKIFEDFLYYNSSIYFFQSILSIILFAWMMTSYIMFYWAIWYLLGRLFPVIRHNVLMVLGEIFIFIPPFKKYIRNQAMLDLASSMASYLDMGEDVINAAKFSEKSCRHLWLKRKLKVFIEKTSNGENWVDAWRAMKLDFGISDLIIHNSAASENPAAGFDVISNWFYQKQIRSVKSNALWFSLAFTAINASIVFFIAFSIFKLLVEVIYVMG